MDIAFHKIDIIIPVYNALNDLKKCISSVLDNTELIDNRLILINDCSPDPDISPYLENICREQKGKNIVIINNDINLGFPGTINIGMQQSSNRDVLLLNSDTVVSNNWLNKLIYCAYCSEEIGTVTPLSNNASLCSIPQFCAENTLPASYNIQEYASFIESISLKRYPHIPVANGFCMYIKRTVISQIGLFDNITFERGYGEENDFCYRAEQAGFIHVMCDDTFVFHKGSSSFVSDEKKKYMQKHENILNVNFALQNKKVAEHCAQNPNYYIQDNVNMWIILNNKKINILYLLQSDFKKDAADHIGGTQLHVKDLTEGLRHKYNIFVAARNDDYLNLTAYINDRSINYKFYIGKRESYEHFRNKEIAKIYFKILKIFQIKLIHIHHTKNLTHEIYYQAESLHIPIVVTLHDYYTICPQITMVSGDELCIGKDSSKTCKRCLNVQKNINTEVDFINIWRREHEKVLKKATYIIVPSHSAESVLNMYFPDITSKLKVITHGMPNLKMESLKENHTNQFHVAFIGGINVEKGSHTSYELIKNSPSDITWYLFGMWGYNELSMLDKKNYIKTGLYERDELPHLLSKNQIDLVCILPILSETFCYTLSEAIMCGIPVIAKDTGALGERMREYDCGWLVDSNSNYIDIMSIINRIKDKGSEYQNKKNKVKQVRLKAWEQMCTQYHNMYSKLLDTQTMKFSESDPDDLTWILDAHLLAENKRTNWMGNSNVMQTQIDDLNNQLFSIKNSFAYKCAKVFMEINIPGKKYIKKVLFFFYNVLKKKRSL